MNSMHKRVGEFFRTKRVERGISQRDAAKKLRYSSSQFISNFERGLCALPLKKIGVLIDYYNLPKEPVIKFLVQENEKRIREGIMGKKSGAGARGRSK